MRAFAEAAAAEERMLGLLSIGSGGQPESNLVLVPLLLGGSNMAGWPVFGCGEIGSGCVVCACFSVLAQKEGEWGEVLAAASSSRDLWRGAHRKPCMAPAP